ncbi:MAG: UDP-2,4-diacetamido-2,4,6-trideoxy-beta-L-altropyranose hydrolase [Oscillospiraceae bacterium]
MIIFRADGNAEVGLGHVMRCLSIADEVKRNGDTCIFVISDEAAKTLIEARGFETVILGSRFDDMESEIDSFINIVKQRMPSAVVIDSYYVTLNYLQAISNKVKTVYIDDINAFEYPVDLLVNYNIYAEDFNYKRYLAPPALALGCEFAPLRKEFRDSGKDSVSGPVKKMLILSGGADPLHATVRIISKVLESEMGQQFEYHVVSGAVNCNRAELRLLTAKNHRVILHENVTTMAELMSGCDLAISAGGSTLYELCACGIPAISYSFVDNQLPGVAKFAQLGIIEYAGDLRNDEEQVLENIALWLTKMIESEEKRYAASERMRRIVDGMGAKRIVNRIAKLC